jgi:ATP/maltotriose-dependent transcriptional regulator MalT
LLNKILVQPAITEDARIRAHQSLERTLAQLPSQVNRSSISGQTEDDLFLTSQTVLAELIDIADHYPRTGSLLEKKPAPNRQDMLDPLTAREIEVLQQIALGKTNQQIAAAFVLSVGTIKWYSRQIYQKLGVGNRTEAVARARKIHLLD